MLIALVCCAIWLAWQPQAAKSTQTCGEQWTGVRQPRCRELEYYVTIYKLDVFCGRDSSGALKRCPESALKQACGSEQGCKFDIMMLPFGSLRKGPSYWNICKDENKMVIQFERTLRSAVGKKAKAKEKVPVFRVKEMNPTAPYDCGILALAVKSRDIGFVSVSGSNVSHFDGHMAKYYLPFPCPYENPMQPYVNLHKETILMDINRSAGGKQIQLQIQLATAFVWRKFMNGSTGCFRYSSRILDDGTPRIDCTKDMPRGEDRVKNVVFDGFNNLFERLRDKQAPWDQLIWDDLDPDIIEPDIPRFPNTRCQRASYLYGVVQAKVACHAECLRLGRGKCYTVEANAVCGDEDQYHEGCEFLVEMDRTGAVRDGPRDEIRLQNDRNSAMSQRLEQNLFLALDKDAPEPEMCDRLRVAVYDHDCSINTKLGGPILLDVPYPSEAEGIVVKEYSLNTSFECTGSQQSFPKYPIHINLTMIFVPLWTVTSQGLLECADLSSIHPSLFECKKTTNFEVERSAEPSILRPNNRPFARKVKDLVKKATGKSLRKVCYPIKPNKNAEFLAKRACVTV